MEVCLPNNPQVKTSIKVSYPDIGYQYFIAVYNQMLILSCNMKSMQTTTMHLGFGLKTFRIELALWGMNLALKLKFDQFLKEP